jgi:hypothetical protein
MTRGTGFEDEPASPEAFPTAFVDFRGLALSAIRWSGLKCSWSTLAPQVTVVSLQ